mgnify:FL=1|jgi:hypothetical protein
MKSYNFGETISKKNRNRAKSLKNAEKRCFYIVLLNFFDYLCTPNWTF